MPVEKSFVFGSNRGGACASWGRYRRRRQRRERSASAPHARAADSGAYNVTAGTCARCDDSESALLCQRGKAGAARRMTPVHVSLCVGASPAGVGKTTCLVQLASAYAHEHADTKVLVVDFSIHGDTTSQLLGAYVDAARIMPPLRMHAAPYASTTHL